MGTKNVDKIGSSFTRQELRNLDQMREKLDYLGLDDNSLITLLREARHWRSGSKLRLAHIIQKVVSDDESED